MKRAQKKLHLNRETLQALEPRHVGAAVAGQIPIGIIVVETVELTIEIVRYSRQCPSIPFTACPPCNSEFGC
jgi:hypothetical protein